METNPNWPTRYASNAITIAANSSEQTSTYTTVDDYRARTLRTLYVGITTKGIVVRLYVQGRKIAEIDCTRFANGNVPLDLDFVVPAQIQLQVSFQDASGTGSTAVPVVVGYAPDPAMGP
jgi:hypothetical protein